MSEQTQPTTTETAPPAAAPAAAPPSEKKPLPKIRSITVDTFTAIQKNDMLDKFGAGNGTVKHDEWKD